MTRAATLTSDGVAIRFRAPAAALSAFVIDYGFYDSGPAGERPRHNEYLPGAANVTITFDAGEVSAAIRNHRHRWTNDAALFGPTSHLMQVDSAGGRMIGFGVTAMGWARLFGKHADRCANRVLPLAELWGETRVRRLYEALAEALAASEDAAVATLDRHLTAMLLPATRDAPLVRALAELVREPAADDCDALAAALGVQPGQLRRIAKHYFGFGPKLLLRRNRFIRAMAALTGGGDPADVEAAVFSAYYDQSHFIRDAQLFLGKTARQFERSITPMMAGMLRARAARFGAPMQGLIAAGRDNKGSGAPLPDAAEGTGTGPQRL